MKTEKELNEDILKITLQIQEKFPELSKFITEMPLKVSDPVSDEISLKNLREYYESLDNLLKNHMETHVKAVKP